MSQPVFRPMLAADLPQVLAIEQLAFSHPWSQRLYQDALERYDCWLVELAGEHVGHAVMQYIADEAHLLNIVIAKAQQGRGLGRQLLEFLLQQAQQRQCSECFLELRASNHGAYHLYEQLGFNEVGRRKNYYPAVNGQEDAILMICSLGV